MAEIRAKEIQQVRKCVYAAIESAACIHVYVEEWKRHG